MPTEFVDRDEHLVALRALVERLARGRGGACVVDGVFGMGKSALLSELVRRADGVDPALSGCRVVHTRCYSGSGPDSAYGTIVEVLLRLAPAEREDGWIRRLVRATGRGAARSAPEVLSALVPGLGALFATGREATQAALDSGSMPGDSLLPYQHGAANQIVQALLEQARSGPPVLVLIDDVQYVDPSSLQILHRLLELIPGEPLAFVLGHGTGDAAADGATPGVDETLRSWELDRMITRRTLAGLPEEAVAELVRLRRAPEDLTVRLNAMTRGHPIFVTLCLQEWRQGDGADLALPRDVDQAVARRVGRLTDSESALLTAGAVQGETFFTCVAAEMAGLSHEETMERLRRLSRTRRLVHETDPPWWAADFVTDCYRFEHRALQRAIYEQQTTQQRRSRHARAANALAGLSAPAGPGSEAPLELRLETARHLRLGGPETRARSARAHVELARGVAAEGLSFAEAERHGVQAFTDARRLPPGEERDRGIVAAVELLLSLTEVRWRGQHQQTGGPHIEGVDGIDALAAEAERAAARRGDPELIARTTLLRGKTLLATRGLHPSLEKLREAVERARECGDAVGLFVATVEYGRQLPKSDLAAGLAELREAERMYASEPRLGDARDPVLQHARNLGEMQLGITLYDSGHLGEARDRLLRCVDRLRTETLQAELPIALNYLAQVHIALGEEDSAAEVLSEALAFEEERGAESGWHAYNTALRALLLSRVPGRQAEARALAGRAWEETLHTWLVNLVPIVRNLTAEVLIETAASEGPGSAERALLEEAHRLAERTCEEVRSTGMARSGIAAHTLRARALLRGGHPAAAAWQAREALRILDEKGDMPALRTEEVLYHAALALDAGGAPEDARALLARARAEVERKAGHLADPARRERFRTAVPLNRLILGTGAG
ncbi:ATP-binding protein [Streptomyces sp. AJS327]|uniref:AAA family ATPase n=1 Tax=Streptomyces sp. AJS327 TaxID=2545265 RepID=UPI0015DFEC66|nr:AAA family ATPase [Streptomyces sp. AJS327]MBA0050418.1 ATP-binding protein [Streptomyces sp. AJS327]